MRAKMLNTLRKEEHCSINNLIREGSLFDVSETAADAGFKCQVAIDKDAWEDCITWTAEDTKRMLTYQDEMLRLWDVVCMAAMAFKYLKGDTVFFQVLRVPRNKSTASIEPVTLVALSTIGDDGQQVLVISLDKTDEICSKH